MAVGLKTHIWNNNLKSLALLAGFPVLLLILAYALSVLLRAYSTGGERLDQDLIAAAQALPGLVPWVTLGAGVWFVIAWFSHQAMIDAATGAKPVSRKDAPELYNLLENLCISRGVTMPRLKIIETSAMNAYASGLTEKQYTITVTRGLLARLEREEVEAVLAHELTHILNRDVRLLVVSVIFVGIISMVVEILFRGMLHGGARRAGGARRGKSGNAGALIAIAIAAMALAWLLAVVIRFAISRKREYMADAGAVELTKNPDAMIAALDKISIDHEVDAPPEVRQMFLYDRQTGLAGWFATHPPMEKRIEALIAHAGGRRPGPAAPPGGQSA